MSEETNIKPMSSLSSLILASNEAERDKVALDEFADYLRIQTALISKYEGVCESLKTWLDEFDNSKTFNFETVIAQLKHLPSLKEQIKELRERLKKCEPLPELHDKSKVVEEAKAVCDRCEKEMVLEEIEQGCTEVEKSITKVKELLDSFSEDEKNLQNALQIKLEEVRKSLEEKYSFMWQDDSEQLSAKIKTYTVKHDLSEVDIQTLISDGENAVKRRKTHMAEVEDENRQLMNNRHISEGYLTLRSSVCTKDGYDRTVSELLDRLREIRSENFKNTMKVIGKILLYILKAVGIIFVLIWTIIKVFLPHDDDD